MKLRSMLVLHTKETFCMQNDKETPKFLPNACNLDKLTFFLLSSISVALVSNSLCWFYKLLRQTVNCFWKVVHMISSPHPFHTSADRAIIIVVADKTDSSTLPLERFRNMFDRRLTVNCSRLKIEHQET